MGITGLLPLLKSIQKPCTLKKFAGQTLGIDAFGWLHRGSAACAVDLALDKPTKKYVEFAVGRVRMLLDFGIIPYLVFDGDSLPSKAGTNAERRKQREEAKATGLALLQTGKQSQAYRELQKSVSVTPYMAKELIEAIKAMKVEVRYVVAPYEADAQLVYLESKGIIDGILSEDSDMLVYGAKRLITKLNQYAECVEIERSDFALCKEISLAGWTDTMFRRMAILSGCDYLPNIGKMGLKTAYRYVRKYKDVEKVIQVLRFENKLSVPADYLERFRDAELTFSHHRVFCPVQKKMVFMQELLPGMKEEQMSFLGQSVTPDIAIGVACGDLHPKSKEAYPDTRSLRPSLREVRRQTAPTQTLKPTKSIESFFNKRVPLAELDPNSLTPSPSQQRLLARHRNASWDSRLISSAPQPRTNSASSTQVRPLRTDRQSFLAKASAVSSYQPPKRPRLCSENQDSPPSKGIKQSPFFAAQDTTPSPSLLKGARNKKPKRGGFELWSDDSVDDVLLGLPDVHETASPEKLEEPHIVPAESDDINSSIPQSSPVSAYYDADGDKVVATLGDPADTKNDPDSGRAEPFEDILASHIQIQRELKTFAYQPSVQREQALRTLSPSKTPQPETRLFLAMTPADQRAALAALPNTGSVKELCTSISLTEDRASSDTKVVVASAQRLHTSSDTKIVLASPRKSPKPTPDNAGQSEISYPSLKEIAQEMPPVTGSEDALIPNSEDEISDDDDGPPATMNLHAFAYVGS
ncbi:Exodeoxyribonuclease 1 [Cyphellophora attinorum]|uniref:Exodeoxyribonuclease 1 n=1 Tax=Cyphellophora attinorum TaxID=1664694 RepID=A0A0N1H9T0_9EURO|nr:Exodeoxyribonuclease 1 [Phialophora attinorum]KPI44413.1 Exodeoxyribonuclease 1 [Phialophora attinorum]